MCACAGLSAPAQDDAKRFQIQTIGGYLRVNFVLASNGTGIQNLRIAPALKRPPIRMQRQLFLLN
jgi:hypothetical protein